ncbi:MAG: YlbF family regulator [Gemmatimonadota bacterium]|nr:MAG: YlbF family regulator [Gemmatimonadota bacterium]
MLEEKALELGRIIGQTEEFKAVNRARDAIGELSEIKAQTQRLEMLAKTIEEHVRERKDPPKEVTAEYEQLLSSIQAHPKYQQLIAAQANFDKIMHKVNEAILEGMKKGADSSIIIPG